MRRFLLILLLCFCSENTSLFSLPETPNSGSDLLNYVIAFSRAIQNYSVNSYQELLSDDAQLIVFNDEIRGKWAITRWAREHEFPYGNGFNLLSKVEEQYNYIMVFAQRQNSRVFMHFLFDEKHHIKELNIQYYRLNLHDNLAIIKEFTQAILEQDIDKLNTLLDDNLSFETREYHLKGKNEVMSLYFLPHIIHRFGEYKVVSLDSTETLYNSLRLTLELATTESRLLVQYRFYCRKDDHKILRILETDRFGI